MATDIEAREQLSKDMRDFFRSTTTANAGAANQLVDARLSEEDDDDFITDETRIWIDGGQSGGPVADEERAIASKSGATATAKRNFSVTVQSGVIYEVHRLFSAADKDAAITVALDLVTPVIFDYINTTIVTVADQFDYSLTATGLYENTPHSVHVVSTGDSERDIPIYAWEIRDGTTLHLKRRINGGKTLRLFGIGKAALSSIDQPQLMILASRAAMYLYEGVLSEARNDQVARFERLLQMETNRYNTRKALYKRPAPPATMRTEAFDVDGIDFDFSVT